MFFDDMATYLTLDEMLDALKITGDMAADIRREAQLFPVRVPAYYFNLINKDDSNDPIRKLCFPSGQMALDDGQLDTSGEMSNTVVQGVQHKYERTALVLCCGECAMYCRHCFRRRLAGKETTELAHDPAITVSYLHSHPEINNVLLSGGDALMLSDSRIKAWLYALADVPTLDFVRIGTRVPVSYPYRVLEDPSLVRILAKAAGRIQLYVVTHFNHPAEITKESMDAVDILQSCGIVVKNQTVLLKGVNDNPEVLGTLLSKLTSFGVVPHYIFQCRPVQGVSNKFQVPLKEGRRIVDAALAMQNGMGKSADYTMSHVTGKIAILGEYNGKMLFKYRQNHDTGMLGKVFGLNITDDTCWLPDNLVI